MHVKPLSEACKWYLRFVCVLLTAAWVWEEKEGGGQESKSWQTAGVGHVVFCFWEAPVLQHQRPGGYHQTACGKTRRQHEHFGLTVNSDWC